MIRDCHIAFVAILFVAVTSTAANIYSPGRFQFYSVPNWMPPTVAATNTPGSDSISDAATTNVNKRVIDTNMKAAVDRSLEAACEREYFFQLSSREGSHTLGTTWLTLNDRRITNRAIDEYDELIGDFDHEAQYFADGAIGVLQRYQYDTWRAYESSSLSDKYQYVLKNNYISTSVFDDIYGAQFYEFDIDWTTEGLDVLSNRFAVLYGIPWVGEPYESGCMYAGAMMVNPLDENNPPIAEVPHTVNFCDILDRKFSTSYGPFFYDNGSRVLNLRTPAVINQVSSLLDRSINIVDINTPCKEIEKTYKKIITLETDRETLEDLGFYITTHPLYGTKVLKLDGDRPFSYTQKTNYTSITTTTNIIDQGISDKVRICGSYVSAGPSFVITSLPSGSVDPGDIIQRMRDDNFPSGEYFAKVESTSSGAELTPGFTLGIYTNSNFILHQRVRTYSVGFNGTLLDTKIKVTASASHSFDVSECIPRSYNEFDFAPHRQAFSNPKRAESVCDICCARIKECDSGYSEEWHYKHMYRNAYDPKDSLRDHFDSHRSTMWSRIVEKTGYNFDPIAWVDFSGEDLSPMLDGTKLKAGYVSVGYPYEGVFHFVLDGQDSYVITNTVHVQTSIDFNKSISERTNIRTHGGSGYSCYQTISNYVEWDWASDRIYNEQQ